MQRFDGSEIIWTFKNVGTTRTATGKIDGKVVATITNLKKGTTASDLTVDGDVITVSKNALATTAVNLNRVMLKGNYTLALADDVTKSELTKARAGKFRGLPRLIKRQAERKALFWRLTENQSVGMRGLSAKI